MSKFLDEVGLAHFTDFVTGMPDDKTIEYSSGDGAGGKALRVKDGGISGSHLGESTYDGKTIGKGDDGLFVMDGSISVDKLSNAKPLSIRMSLRAVTSYFSDDLPSLDWANAGFIAGRYSVVQYNSSSDCKLYMFTDDFVASYQTVSAPGGSSLRNKRLYCKSDGSAKFALVASSGNSASQIEMKTFGVTSDGVLSQLDFYYTSTDGDISTRWKTYSLMLDRSGTLCLLAGGYSTNYGNLFRYETSDGVYAIKTVYYDSREEYMKAGRAYIDGSYIYVANGSVYSPGLGEVYYSDVSDLIWHVVPSMPPYSKTDFTYKDQGDLVQASNGDVVLIRSVPCLIKAIDGQPCLVPVERTPIDSSTIDARVSQDVFKYADTYSEQRIECGLWDVVSHTCAPISFPYDHDGNAQVAQFTIDGNNNRIIVLSGSNDKCPVEYKYDSM